MIGLFLGDTDFSELVLKKIKRLSKKYFIIDFSKNNKFKKDNNSNRISIGKFGKIINISSIWFKRFFEILHYFEGKRFLPCHRMC